jgi:very-short-patch-repair endonuclease
LDYVSGRGWEVDFLIPNPRKEGKDIVIEEDGDYFHGNPDYKYNNEQNKKQLIQRRNDKEKTECFKQFNYRVLRFYESELDDNPGRVIEEILKTVSEEFS